MSDLMTPGALPSVQFMGDDQREELRVRVWFGPHLLHDYRAEETAAQSYAQAIGRRFAGLKVTIDAEATADMPPLPCEQLWTTITP